MSSLVKILFLGVTGYIGGSFADALLKHPKANEFEISAFVRSADKAKEVEKVGLKAVTGSLEEAAANAAIIINCAVSGNIPVIEEILAGAKKHYTSTKVPTIFIHTSGTAIIADDAQGKYASSKIFDDTDTETLNALPVTQPHRNTDIPILDANTQGYVTTYIVAPSLIYGLATGKFVDGGVQNPVPTGILMIGSTAIGRGTSGIINQQLNMWSTVEIHDLTDLYVILFNAITGGKEISSGYYFASNGDIVVREVLTEIAKALHEVGSLKTVEPSQFTKEEIAKTPLISAFGVNSRVASGRARALGWKPVHPAEDFLSGIRQSVEVMTKQK